jgi:hypothetical protein
VERLLATRTPDRIVRVVGVPNAQLMSDAALERAVREAADGHRAADITARAQAGAATDCVAVDAFHEAGARDGGRA